MNKRVHYKDITLGVTKDCGRSWLKVWYIKDPHVKHHRENGPALVWSSGMKGWYLDGKEYTEKSYWQELYKRNIITLKKLFIKIL